MAKEFKALNHGTGKIDLTGLKPMNTRVMRPTEIHLKYDGAVSGPSFAIVMEDSFHRSVGEISLEMLNEGLKEIGYEMRKIDA